MLFDVSLKCGVSTLYELICTWYFRVLRTGISEIPGIVMGFFSVRGYFKSLGMSWDFSTKAYQFFQVDNFDILFTR